MNRRFALFTLGAIGLSACTPLPATNPLPRDVRRSLRIAQVEVETGGAAFESARAAEQAGSLARDLETALRAEFNDRMGGAGAVTMQVEISRLNIAGTTATQFGRDQSRLVGSVRLINRDGGVMASYTVQQVVGNAAQTTGGALAAAAVTRSDRYYNALVSGFALDTREQIIGPYLPGERLVRQIAG